ncbi:MAG TPA: ABC transporter permease [Anaerolineae bacterium]
MLNLILKNLFRRKTRTLLTVAGIAVGVAAIVALGAMGEGLRTGYLSMFSGSGADLIMMQKGAWDITIGAVDEDTVNQVAALPEVRAATGMVVGNVTAPGAMYFFVFGYDPDGFAIKRFQIVEGQPLGASHSATRGSHEILLGKQAASVMRLKVGDTLRLTGGAFHVVGIYTSGSGFEDAAAVLSLADAQRLLQKPRQLGAVQIKLNDARQIEQVRAELERRYPRLTISQSSQTADQQQWITYIQGFALGIALLAVVIGGVGMTNAVMMSTFERTREIGTLRALGWSRRRVLTMVLGESVMLGMIGGLAGCAVGAALIGALGQSPAMSFLQGNVSLPLIGQGLLTAMALGAAGGVYPARWASRLLPIEALRYEGGSGAEARLRTSRVKSETLRSLARRRRRTALTIVGISIGLAAVVALNGIADGFIVMFNQMMMTTDVDLVVQQRDTSDLAYSAVNERVGREIAALPDVQSVSGIVISAVETNEAPIFLIMGYAPYEPAIEHFKIVEGRGLSGNREVMIGRSAVDVLKVKVGEVIRLANVGFRVVGIFETGVSYENSAGVISLRDAQALVGKPRQVTMYGIKLNDPQRAQAIAATIEAHLPDVAVSPASEFAENLPDMKRSYAAMGAISALAILVGGIGMMNTMIMSVYERTREIGTLRALGWRRLRVLLTVLKESLALSLIGVVAGAVLAWLLGVLLRQIPLWGDMVRISFSPALLTQALIVALILGLLGGSYPAWRAANLSPAEALRYE